MKKFEYKSVMQIPKIDKIVINVGAGDARDNAKALDAIVKGSVVDVLRNSTGRVTEFIISTATVADYFIQSTEEIKGSLVYSDGEKSFKTTKSFERYIKNQKLDEIKIGSYYTVALNSNNEIAWVEKQENSDLTLGYMIESGKEKASAVRDSKYVAKLYNIIGQVEIYDYAEKVTVSNNQGKVEKMELNAFVDHKNKYIEYTGIFRFGTDDDGKINYIEYPITDPAYFTDGKIQYIYSALGTENSTR